DAPGAPRGELLSRRRGDRAGDLAPVEDGGPRNGPHTPQPLVAPQRSRGAPRPPTLVAPRRSRGAPRPPALVAPRRSRGAPRPPALVAPRRSRGAPRPPALVAPRRSRGAPRPPRSLTLSSAAHAEKESGHQHDEERRADDHVSPMPGAGEGDQRGEQPHRRRGQEHDDAGGDDGHRL